MHPREGERCGDEEDRLGKVPECGCDLLFKRHDGLAGAKLLAEALGALYFFEMAVP